MKNPFFQKALLCLSILLILQSCSIQKRRYTGGFHVEWHNNKPLESDDDSQSTNQKSENARMVSEAEDSISNPVVVHESNILPSVSDKEEKQSNKHKTIRHEHKKFRHHQDQHRNVNIDTRENLQNDQTTPQVHVGASSSLRIMLLSYLLTMISIGLIFFVAYFFYLSSGLIITSMFGIIAIIASIILAIIASVKAMYSIWEMGRTPEIFINRWQAILTIILGLLYLTLFFVIPLFIFMIKVNVTKSREKSAGGPTHFDSQE
ncbi:MAG: hypothetical protein K1X54_02440 [Flavobacteriales bacterium]|nr:hypothetical protein [Flavobacteriales bacterium]